jgi:nucleotide-binding universal stress UspA family protein
MCDDSMPEHGSDGFGHVALCWDGSIESTRAVAQTLWLMKIAKKLSILTVDSGQVESNPEELQLYLAEHDIVSDIIMVKPSGSIGGSLMKVSASCEADIVILGAYGNNHYFERVLGGVTQHFVDHASRPLILVH